MSGLVQAPKVVRLMVKEFCSQEDESCLKEKTPIEASISVGNEFMTFLRGTTHDQLHPRSFTRQKLYEAGSLTGNYRSELNCQLNRLESNGVLNVAKAILSWFLNVPVVASRHLDGLRFNALLEPDGDSYMQLGDLLKRYPRLPNLNAGIGVIPGPVLRCPDDKHSHKSSYYAD
jgi:hypothetical protein